MINPAALKHGAITRTAFGCIIYTATYIAGAPYGAVTEAVEIAKGEPTTPVFIWFGASQSMLPCPVSPNDDAATLGGRWEAFRRALQETITQHSKAKPHEVFLELFTAPAVAPDAPPAET